MNTWFTSDLHLSHKLVAKLRGFTTPVECGEPEHFNPCNLCAPGDTAAHDEALVKNWNRVVRPEDVVWILGDVGMGHLERFAGSLMKLRGRKHLITGNHDDPWPGNRDSFKYQREWLQIFESVQAYARKKVEGKAVMLSHFPYEMDHTDEPRCRQYRLRDMGEILLHGHTHSRQQEAGRQIHVGLDAWGLAPVPMQVIQERVAQMSREGGGDATDGQPAQPDDLLV